MARYRHTGTGQEATAPEGSKRDALMAADPDTWEPVGKPKAKAKADPPAKAKAEPTKAEPAKGSKS
jgi:hypothetical protein